MSHKNAKQWWIRGEEKQVVIIEEKSEKKDWKVLRKQ